MANISGITFPRIAALKHKTKTAIEVIIPLAPVFDSLVLTTCPSAFRRRRRTHMQYTATPMITQTISAPITIPAVRPWAPLPRLPPRLLVLKTQHKGKYRHWRPGCRGFNPRRGRQHSFVEIDHKIFSTVILSLPLIQEGVTSQA